MGVSELWLAIDVEDRETIEQLAYCQTAVKQGLGDLRERVRWVDPQEFHVTVDYLGETQEGYDAVVDGLKRLEALPDLGDVLGYQYVFFGGVNRFDGGALWLGVNQSLGLYRLRYAVRECLAKAGYTHRKDDYDGYTPHLTLGFECPELPAEVRELPLPRVPMALSTLTLWGSFKTAGGAYNESVLYRARVRK